MFLFTKLFSQLLKNDSNIAGGKGASLGEMINAGIPVPDGYVVLSTTFDEFLHKADLIQEIHSILESVDHKAVHSVDEAAEKIQSLIKNAKMPEDIKSEIESQFVALDSQFVAVRSSATAEDGAEHAWAGQLDSYLNTTKDTLLEKVQHCWASLFTPRAIFYRFEKGLHKTHISVAVVVQKMVNSEKSGIAFSVHPVTEDRNQIIIEAGFGLGEAIVSGAVTPDSYVIEKDIKSIIDINVNNQNRALYRKSGGGNEWKELSEKGEEQKLSKEEILVLSDIIIKIENHYGFPCDIEWAYEAGKFYITQSRPITTLVDQLTIEQTFVKAYTRNFSIIMQQAWFAANKESLIEKLELKEYPYTPPYLYYMKDGVEEVWENKNANGWIIAKLVEKIKTDPSFFNEVHDRYFNTLSEMKSLWGKEINTFQELNDYLDKVYKGISDFVILYGALMDKTIPEKYQEMANSFREKDSFFADCNSKLNKALETLYPNFGYLSVYIMREEIGKEINREILEQRDKGFALIPEVFAGATSFIDFVKAYPQYKFEIERGEQDESGLKGQPAFKGLVTGIVHIVKRKDQIDAVCDGEIIVSPMTTPDMLPAMKKAAAFVTDEGGITCHATIIAREMKKPCVIGTKIATQVLKDGDMVEVDADNGVVRIIK